MSNLSKNDPQNIEQNFDELELVAEKAGELNDRVGKIESELGAQTKTLESAALVLDAAIKGLGALKSSVLENDIGALQLALNDKTAHLAREIGRFESAVAEIDRRAESGDEEIKAALLATAQSLRNQFEAKSAEISEWSVRVEKSIAEHAVALAAIPPIIKGADAVGFNPVGEWEAGKSFARMDVVSYAGSSYISNEDGNTDKPSKSKKYTVLAKRAGSVGMGGVGDMAGLTGTILPAQLVPGSATYAVGDVLYATTTSTLAKLAAGSSGQLLSTQGAGAAPIWVTATGGAGDMNGPASATDNAIVRFDGTGGKTVQNSSPTIGDTGIVNIPATTSASSATVGSLTIGNGTAATNVAIGGGNINAGGTGTFGSTVGARERITVTSTSDVRNFVATGNLTEIGYQWANTGTGGKTWTAWSTASSSGLAANGSWILRNETDGVTALSFASTGAATFAGAVSVASTSASTGVGTGALQVAGGIYAGAASVFGSTVTVGDFVTISKNTANQNPIGPRAYNTNTTGYSAFQAFNAAGYLDANSTSFGLGGTTEGTSFQNYGYVYTGTSTNGFRVFTNGSNLRLTIDNTGAATFAGAVTIAGTVIHTLSATPASASAAGTVGTMSWDASYIYICTATNTWKRVAIATW